MTQYHSISTPDKPAAEASGATTPDEVLAIVPAANKEEARKLGASAKAAAKAKAKEESKLDDAASAALVAKLLDAEDEEDDLP